MGVREGGRLVWEGVGITKEGGCSVDGGLSRVVFNVR